MRTIEIDSKTLIPVGDELGIVIDRSLLDELQIDRETPLRITSDGRGLYIEPIPADQRGQFSRREGE